MLAEFPPSALLQTKIIGHPTTYVSGVARVNYFARRIQTEVTAGEVELLEERPHVPSPRLWHVLAPFSARHGFTS